MFEPNQEQFLIYYVDPADHQEYSCGPVSVDELDAKRCELAEWCCYVTDVQQLVCD